MGNCSYLSQFPIHTTTIMLSVNILVQYKKLFTAVFISTVSLKLLNVYNLSFFQATYYVILCPYFQHVFDKK